MPHLKRFTNEQLIQAYKETGSVWRAAKALGICGQSVWERLKAIGYKLASSKWSQAEDAELKTLVGDVPIAEIARRLGRSYAGVASRLSNFGLRSNIGRSKRIRRRRMLRMEEIPKLVKDLENFDGSITQFSRMKGMRPDPIVKSLQEFAPDFWLKYSASHGLGKTICGYCGKEFYPLSNKQKTCSRDCQSSRRVDENYFNGQRKNTIGLDDGICQLCHRKPEKRLSSHHVWGKENDAESMYLIALCSGCHNIIGSLASKKLPRDKQFWERLIMLATMRAEGESRPLGFYCDVDLEPLTEDELLEERTTSGECCEVMVEELD